MRICLACEMVLISCSVLSATCSIARAELITFERERDFDPNQLDEKTEGSIIRLGLIATFTANVGTLNVTGSSFGINAPGSDVPAVLDTFDETFESITITFNKPVEFKQLTINQFSIGETAKLTVGDNPSLTLVSPQNGTHVYDFPNANLLTENLLAAGQPLVIGSGIGNGFSLEGFQVNTVPEPACLSIALPILAGVLLRRKRKQ